MSEHYERRNRFSSDVELAQRKIFIGGLSYDTTDENLRRYFSVYGDIEDSVVMKDPATKRSRGFGFITFTSNSSVDLSLADEPHAIDSRKVEVKRAVPKVEGSIPVTYSPTKAAASTTSKSTSSIPNPTATSNKKLSAQLMSIAASTGAPVNRVSNISTQAPSTATSAVGLTKPSNSSLSVYTDDPAKYNSDEYANKKIFVGGLHYDTRDDDFKEYFEKYGRVLHGEVMFNRETHKSRGFGFIIFESEHSVDRVCDQTNHSIREKSVEVKRAIPRSQMPPGGSSPTTNSGLTTISNKSPSGETGSMFFNTASNSPLKIKSVTTANTSSSISTPIQTRGTRRVISGSTSTTTVLMGTPANLQTKKPTPIAKPVPSYAAALLQGNGHSEGLMVTTDSNDMNGSELDATTTVASQSSGLSIANYDIDFNIFGFQESNRSRAFSEPNIKGYSTDSNSLFGESFLSSSNHERRGNSNFDATIGSNFEARPSSLSFDHTSAFLSTSPASRNSSLSPSLSGFHYQKSHSQSSDPLNGSITSPVPMNWLSASNTASPLSARNRNMSMNSTSSQYEVLSNSQSSLFSDDISEHGLRFIGDQYLSSINQCNYSGSIMGNSGITYSQQNTMNGNTSVNDSRRSEVSWASLVNGHSSSPSRSTVSSPHSLSSSGRYYGSGPAMGQPIQNGAQQNQMFGYMNSLSSQSSQYPNQLQMSSHSQPYNPSYSQAYNNSDMGGIMNGNTMQQSRSSVHMPAESGPPQGSRYPASNSSMMQSHNNDLDHIPFGDIRMDSQEYQSYNGNNNNEWHQVHYRR